MAFYRFMPGNLRERAFNFSDSFAYFIEKEKVKAPVITRLREEPLRCMPAGSGAGWGCSAQKQEPPLPGIVV